MKTFTFYGDLVGLSSAYEASPEGAYQKLHEYYNEMFIGLSAYYEGSSDRYVEMFSDSIVVRGDDPIEFLCTIAPVYMKLLSKGLLMRGGIVTGKLKFDARMQRCNFEKKLPDSDILARCVALERKTKGARLVIEKSMAQALLSMIPEWLTLEGYASIPMHGDTTLTAQRSICPLPDGTAFELLYPVLANEEKDIILRRIKEMEYLIAALPKDISIHHSETTRLLEHSLWRITDKRSGQLQ